MSDFSLEVFEGDCRENGIKYWYAHEFMKRLGYESWASFQAVLNRAMGSCTKLNLDPTEAFIPELVIDGDGRQLRTFRLTRFACFLVTMHADSKKPQVAQAKTALAAIADALIQARIDDEAIERIEVRDELKAGESIMSAAAKSAGLESTQYGIFKDAGFRGMYNMGLRDLVHHKGAPKDKTLYDYMGKTELAANLFRVTQTAERIRNQRVSGLNQLADAARTVGAQVRSVMLESSGVAPESLPLTEAIGDVKKRIKSAHKEMKKLDAPTKKLKR